MPNDYLCLFYELRTVKVVIAVVLLVLHWSYMDDTRLFPHKKSVSRHRVAYYSLSISLWTFERALVHQT